MKQSNSASARSSKRRSSPKPRKPAYKLKVDFGDEIGVKRSSAQITKLYTADALIGKQVIAVTNFPPKQIGPIKSEVLVTGFIGEEGTVTLAVPDGESPQRNPLGVIHGRPSARALSPKGATDNSPGGSPGLDGQEDKEPWKGDRSVASMILQLTVDHFMICCEMQ